MDECKPLPGALAQVLEGGGVGCGGGQTAHACPTAPVAPGVELVRVAHAEVQRDGLIGVAAQVEIESKI